MTSDILVAIRRASVQSVANAVKRSAMVRGIPRLYAMVAATVSIVILADGMVVPAAFAASTTSDPRPAITLTSPNAQFNGQFGLSVAISDHIEVVGAPFESVGGFPGAGHAYIFDAATGTLIATLKSPMGPEFAGDFGFSVAISGTNVVVGAPGESVDGTSETGHAYIFTTTGSLTATLTSPTPQLAGFFGSSVAISGTNVVVGAPGESVGGSSFAGHAYIFTTTGSLTTTLTSPTPQTFGQFGHSVSVSGTSVVVGAPQESVGGTSSAGHAYIFGTTTGSLTTTLTSPTPQTLGAFGFSVDVSGTSVVVGAPGIEGSGQAGHAYIFTTTGSLTTTLTSPNALSNGQFGFSVANDDDPGRTTVLVGAPGESAGGVGVAGGHAHLCTTTCPSSGTLTSPNGQTLGMFGSSVANDDTPNRTTVLVGAPGESAGGFSSAGHAYLYIRLKT